jgi:type I restriction enzyme S subunit
METVKLGLLIKKTKVARCGEHSYPVLSITKQDGIIMQSEKFKKRIASADTSDYKIIPRGKLVQGIHIDEGNFGIQDIVDNGIVSPAYGVWDVNDGLVIPKYLEMVLRSPKSIEFYRSKLTGTVNRRGHMSDADFLSMDIPLPDRDTQSKILKTMKQTTSVLYSRQQQLAKLDELIKARFVEMFGDKNYHYESLINLILDGTSLSYGIVQPGNDGTGDMGVLRPVDIVDGKLTMSSIKYIDRSIGEGFKKTELDGDELLITVRGTTGITALTDGRFAGMNVTRGIAVIRYNRKKINPLYLNAYFNTDESQRYIQEHTRGATLQQINLSDLRIQRIMLPPLSLQNQFAAFVAEVDKSKVEVQKALDQTQLLFDSLMQQYFG